MAGYFAELKNNIVQRVVSATDAQWCVDNLGGEWVQTYYATEGKNYAGIGYTYLPDVDNFITSQPFPSWVLGEKLEWQPPVQRKSVSDNWDEKTQSWLQ